MIRSNPASSPSINSDNAQESSFRAYLRFPAFLLHGAESDCNYNNWFSAREKLEIDYALRIREHIANPDDLTKFHLVILYHQATFQDAERTLASLTDQHYPFLSFDICKIDHDPALKFNPSTGKISYVNTSTTIEQLNSSKNLNLIDKWIIFLLPGDVLPPYTLHRISYELSSKPECSILYFDDDQIEADDRHTNPRFKPDWSLTHFLSTDFIGNSVVLSAKSIIQAGGVNPDHPQFGIHDLILRIIDISESDGSGLIVHLPGILLHRRPMQGVSALQADRHKAALVNHLTRTGKSAEISTPLPGIFRVQYLLPQPYPKVSIIIPTRDSLEFLRTCIESVIGRTRYAHVEILVIDNQSSDPDALQYLNSLPHRNEHGWEFRVLRYNKPFNFSAINNFAAHAASGDLLCLLNNDTEVISSDWLEEMVGHLQQPGAGIVGAKLYYPDGRIQHAGDVIGRGGCANHLHAFLGRDDPGYCNRAVVAQELSAVTAACMLTTKSLFLSLGGLDEKHLRVAFNDVDFCLKVRKAGYKVIWTPYAELFHHESVSRGKNRGVLGTLRARFEAFIMRRRWKLELQNDPFYNPLLCRKRPDFSLCDESVQHRRVK